LFRAGSIRIKGKLLKQGRILTGPLGVLQGGDFEKAKSLLSNDYQFSGPVPEPINAEAWLGIHKNLKKALPNLDYHFHVDGVEGDVTKISAELKGTHSGVLDLSPVGLGVTPATDKSFALPREHGKVTCKGDKVVSWVMDRIEGGGLMGILGQLGITVPTM
jgi:hypothetical protein